MRVAQVVERRDVEVRDLLAGEVESYLEYWHGASDTALEQLGVDRKRLYPRAKMREALLRDIEINGRLQMSKAVRLAVVYQGLFAGVHELTELQVGEQAVMHAHFLRTFRGRGIGTVAYVAAMDVFFDRFQLERIVFKTPICNRAANRVKEKLGLVPSGRDQLDLPFLRKSLEVQTYYVYRNDMLGLTGRGKVVNQA